jgi:hypothetical protein
MITRQRAEAAAQALDRATDALNHALQRAEDLFYKQLGKQAYGRLELERDPAKYGRVRAKDEQLFFFSFQDGRFYLEIVQTKETKKTLLLRAPREHRLNAAGRLEDLWKACGATPAPRPQGSP